MYNNYINFVKNVVQNNNLNNFKSNNYYRDILEHLSKNQGDEYLFYIKNNTIVSLEDIIEFCSLNDKIGNPLKDQFIIDGKELLTSPSNFRYIFHSFHILKYFETLGKEINIIEVGGGYGGLCLAISFFSKYFNLKIKNYNIIDLDDIIQLQSLYLSNHNLNFNTNFHSSNSYGITIENIDNNFLISNYCFSEIENIHQEKYREILFPKITHGFLVWNHISLYNFGFEYRIEDEYPQTDTMYKMNKYVYF